MPAKFACVDAAFAIKNENGKGVPNYAGWNSADELDDCVGHTHALPREYRQRMACRISQHPVKLHVRQAAERIVLGDEKPSARKTHDWKPPASIVVLTLFSEIPQRALPVGDSPLRPASRARPVDGVIWGDEGFHLAFLALETHRRLHTGVLEVSGVGDRVCMKLRHGLGRASLRPNGALLVQEMSCVGDVHVDFCWAKAGEPRISAPGPRQTREWQVSTRLQARWPTSPPSRDPILAQRGMT